MNYTECLYFSLDRKHFKGSTFAIVFAAVLDAMREKEAALDELRAQMESDKEEELKKLKQKLEDEKNQLQSVLSDKTSELDIAREQLKRLEYELAKKEQGMGSVASSLEKLREELMSVQGELAVAQREKDTEMKERIRLQVSTNIDIVTDDH